VAFREVDVVVVREVLRGWLDGGWSGTSSASASYWAWTNSAHACYRCPWASADANSRLGGRSQSLSPGPATVMRG